jgi:hypothetical protein
VQRTAAFFNQVFKDAITTVTRKMSFCE